MPDLAFAIRAQNESKAAFDAAASEVDRLGKAADSADGPVKRVGEAVETAGNKADSSHGKFGKVTGALGDMAKIAGGFVIGAGLTSLPGFLKEAAEAAADDEASTAILNSTLANLADRAGAVNPSLQDMKAG